MKKIFIPFIASIVIISSCDKIDNPIPDNVVNLDGISFEDSAYVVSTPGMRKILIEEFTGHLCTFCPDGSREIERLDSIYGNQLIPMSIHAGGFADPLTGTDINGDLAFDYTTDFRTTPGTSYYSTFGVASNPAATVSRINSASITGLSQWDADFMSIMGDAPKVSIGLSVLYDDSTRTVKAVVNTEWLSSETGNFNLQLYLVEDSVVDWQLDNGVHTQFYTHRHVFRETINGTWGSPIPTSNLGDTDTQEAAIILPTNWNKDNCIVIAHIYKSSPDYEIIQAEELHVIE
ncbi:MAG: Omp28 family outer membrane lipoprotein [Flavobacteriales bacterium]|nr:Omp28 family outer membrane lipoprotein [Flavobacteriales bacterium]